MTDDHRGASAGEADVDREIRRLTAVLARSAPEPPPLPVPGETRPVPLARVAPDRHRWLAAAAAVALIAGAVGWWSVSRRDPVQPVTADGVTVDHQRIRWSQEVQLSCEGGTGAGMVMVELDVFVDVAGQRVRQRAAYPDGSVRDQVWEGPEGEPTRRYERGSSSYVAPACPDWGPVAAEDTREVMGRIAAPPDFAPGEHDSGLRSIEPGARADDIGRPAQVLREETGGLAELDVEDAPLVPFRQTTEWYVEPDTGRLLQITRREDVEGVSRVTTSMVVLDDEEVVVDPAVFDTEGYELMGDAPRDGSAGKVITADEVTSAVDVGPDRYWTADPAPGGAEAAARRFAVEVLGWEDPDVTPVPGTPPEVAQRIAVADLKGHTASLVLAPVASGGWDLVQIGSGDVPIVPGPDDTQLGPRFPVGTAEVVIEGHLDPGGRRAWRAAVVDSSTGVILPGTSGYPMLHLLLLYRDENNHTIGAATLGYGGPGTEVNDPSPGS